MRRRGRLFHHLINLSPDLDELVDRKRQCLVQKRPVATSRAGRVGLALERGAAGTIRPAVEADDRAQVRVDASRPVEPSG